MPDSSLARIVKIISSHFNVIEATISDATTAYDVNGWDSLAHVYLMMRIETEFNINLPLDVVAELADVGALARLVDQITAGRT